MVRKWHGCSECGRQSFLVHPPWIRIQFTLPCHICGNLTEWLNHVVLVGDTEFSEYRCYLPACNPPCAIAIAGATP